MQLLQGSLETCPCCQDVRASGGIIHKLFNVMRHVRYQIAHQVWSLSEDQSLAIYDRTAGKKLKKVKCQIYSLDYYRLVMCAGDSAREPLPHLHERAGQLPLDRGQGGKPPSRRYNR